MNGMAEVYVTILAPYKQASRELCDERYQTLSIKITALHGLHKKLQGVISNFANRGSGISLAQKLVAPSKTKISFF